MVGSMGVGSILLLVMMGSTAVVDGNSVNKRSYQPFGTEQIGCKGEALGMEDGAIKDTDITASSYFDFHSVGPHNARVRQDHRGGAWCPRSVIQDGVTEWLEVNLHTDHWITATETQGRFGQGQGREFTQEYRIEYWRENKGVWMKYRNHTGHSVLQGNDNTYMANKQELYPALVASKVRFLPHSSHPRTVCMRVELYGCPYDSPVAGYTAPPGHEFSPGLYLEDVFDGDGGAGDRRGLGLLTDGRLGGKLEFKQADLSVANGWIGWKNKKRPIEINLRLSQPMVVRGISIGVYSQPDMGIQVFRQIVVRDGLSLTSESAPLVIYPPNVNELTVGPNWVRIPVQVNAKPTDNLLLTMDFLEKWILVSEVYVHGEPQDQPASEITEKPIGTVKTSSVDPKNPAPSYNDQNLDGSIDQHFVEATEAITEKAHMTEVNKDEPEGEKEDKEEIEAQANEEGNKSEDTEIQAEKSAKKSDAYIGIVIGVLSMTVLLLLSIIVLILRKNRQKIFSKHSMLKSPLKQKSGGISTISMKEMKVRLSPLRAASLSSQEKGVLGHLEDSDTEEASLYHEPYRMVLNQDQEYRKKLVKNYSCGRLCDYDDPKMPPATQKFGSTPLFNLNVGGAPMPRAAGPTNRRGGKGPPTSYSFNAGLYEKDYMKPCFEAANGPRTSVASGYSVPITKSKSQSLGRTLSTTMAGTGENFYAATDIVQDCPAEYTWTGREFTCMVAGPNWRQPDGNQPFHDIPQISRNSLRLVEKLGEGKFGLVHLCELDGGDISSRRKPVLVRSLWKGSTPSQIDDYMGTCGELSRLQHPNLACIIGKVDLDQPVSCISEYMEYGDLHHFLNAQSPLWIPPNKMTDFRIHVAMEVASGMKYLESVGFVHRDLSARNCLLGKGYSVKLTDVAMFRTAYTSCYYVTDNQQKLPIRWMPWESFTVGSWTSSSDVWSYGVIIYELLTSCRSLPYAILSDQQLIQTLRDRVQVLPCSVEDVVVEEDRELSDLMLQCWARDPAHRPSFAHILDYLHNMRPTAGYS